MNRPYPYRTVEATATSPALYGDLPDFHSQFSIIHSLLPLAPRPATELLHLEAKEQKNGHN
jgi:hypothetical protein